MLLRIGIIALLASLQTSLAQNVTLIDPLTRYGNITTTLPPFAFPVLHTDFTSPPDCGETSYNATGTGRLRGLRTLITGGDSGIGRAVVIAYLREGAQVAINYLPEEEADAQALAEFLEPEGLLFERIPGDLQNETFCTYLVNEAARRLGGLDILIGNAGYSGPQWGRRWLPIANQSTTQLERTFRTNVFANLFLTRAAVPLLPRGGSIIFTTSAAAHSPHERMVDYGASKAAVTHMINSLARQLAPNGVRVNGVGPALTYSPFLPALGWTDETIALALEDTPPPFRRLEQPAELAPLYVSLADPSGTFTSGNVYFASGGSAFP